MTTEHAHTSPAKATAKCPFSHIQSKDAPPVSHDSVHSVRDSTSNGYAVKPSDEFARQGICPFPHASAAAASQTSADPATCPMGYGPQPSTAEAPQTAQCPMGFSSADGPRMTEFHCVICKSLLYDTVQLGCSCRYCRHCVAAYNDCPLCGADISSRTPDPKLQGMCQPCAKVLDRATCIHPIATQHPCSVFAAF